MEYYAELHASLEETALCVVGERVLARWRLSSHGVDDLFHLVAHDAGDLADLR